METNEHGFIVVGDSSNEWIINLDTVKYLTKVNDKCMVNFVDGSANRISLVSYNKIRDSLFSP